MASCVFKNLFAKSGGNRRMIVRESIEFERGRSPEDIKRLFGREYHPGEIILRPDNGYSPHKTIMMFLERLPADYAGTEHFKVATLGYIDIEGKAKPYGYKFELDNYNTGNYVDADTKDIRFPTSAEELVLKRFLNRSKISKIKERLGMFPILNGKLIKESLNFERGIEPKKASKIGLTAPKRFKTIEEFTNHIITALPLIFDGKIPEDILSSHESGMLPEKYYEKIAWWLTENGFEMPNGNNDWEGPIDNATAEFKFWSTPIVQKLEQILGEKRWSEY
jgi:hypothetical protein